MAAKAKDWPLLHAAVDRKIEDQREFVDEWDRRVRGTGNPNLPIVTERVTIAATVLEAESGIGKMQVSRWRKSLADPDAYHLKMVLAACRKAGLEPDDNYRSNGTGDNEWFTPPAYIEAARRVLGTIDLDPASHEVAQRRIKATQYYTAADNGLDRDWHGRVWLNPPYSRGMIDAFTLKLVAEIENGNVSAAVVLTHNYTDTAWFHGLLDGAAAVCFPRGRIKFVNAVSDACNPTQGQTFFYYGPNVDHFAEVFGAFGAILYAYV